MAQASGMEKDLDLQPLIDYVGVPGLVEAIGIQRVIDAVGMDNLIASLTPEQVEELRRRMFPPAPGT